MKIPSAILPALVTLSARLRAAKGRRRAAYAFAFGAVMALSMPPFNLFPLLWICLPALILMLQGTQNKKQAFAAGWCFAFGFLTFSLYWIAASMLVDLEHFWWAIPLSVAGLPALFAIYYGIAAVLARRAGLAHTSGAILFGLFWFAADYARGHLFTGFPWNLIGYGWSGVLPVLQITSVFGIYGLTLVTAVAASLPAALFMTEKGKFGAARGGFALSLLLLIVIGVWGEARLMTTTVADVPDVRIRIVQPNIDQKKKWLIGERERDFDRLLTMTSAPSDQPLTHVIWPETASTFYLSEDAFHRQQIAEHIPAAGTVITGVIRRALDRDGNTHFYNSLVAVDGLGRLVSGYDKVHLVPFGEYMPWRKYLPPSLKALAASDQDFSPGDGARSLRVLGLPPFSPLICYEVIFPGKVIDPRDRPDFIVNVTNDAWYGTTIGPYQHFAIARVRAIEEGLPLMRAANTGISGVFDPLGRILSSVNLNKQGIIDTPLPTPLGLTLFGKLGDIPLLVVFLLSVLTVFALKAKKN